MSASASPAAARLRALRARMAEAGVEALVIPSEDPHLSEYVPACFARRAFISGFDGSAGTAVVARSGPACLWTDGRYFLQAARQLSDDWQLMRTGVAGTPRVEEWLASSLERGTAVGIDPATHSAAFALELRRRLESAGIVLRCLEENLVDSVWGNERPPYPGAPARRHPERVAGRSASEKLALVRAAMEEEGADAFVVSALDEVAYLLNLRGGDVHCTPVVLAYALVQRSSVTLFVDGGKLPQDVRAALDAAGVSVAPYAAALRCIADLSAAGQRVWLDPERTNFAIYSALDADAKLLKKSPLLGMKAVKNAAELDGMRAAHLRDAVALAAALSSLEAKVRGGQRVTEVDVDVEVTGRRAAHEGYLDNSFDTIAGYGANGAIIHYRAEADSCAVVGKDALLLLDSGAQYVDGTTDVTRTVHFGEPSPLERECFTRVLKGHIALATAVFPEGTPGFVVDAFARRPLWAVGLDYRHGTGHGVGAALSVHEGPQRIAGQFENRTPLEAGMVVSNEPGYYADGEFGIRIENLLVVVEKDTPNRFGGNKYLGFEPLTLVPFQRELIDIALLDDQELAYLNAYHAQVRAEVLPAVPSGTEGAGVRAWLLRSTEPLGRAPAPRSKL